MLKLAHQSNILRAMKYLSLALLLSLSLPIYAQVWSDKYLFVIGDMAIRESQIEKTRDYLKTMNCVNPNGVLASAFKSLWQDQKKPHSFIPFYQLMVYSNSYKIHAESKVKSLYKKAILEKNCDPKNKVDVNSSFFQKFLELEIFLRSRYLPGQARGQDTKGLSEGSLKSLLESLKDQIKTQVLLGN